MSDQDFFFDEDDETREGGSKDAEGAAKDRSSRKPADKPSRPKAEARRPEPASGSFFEQSTTMAIASLIGIIGLLLGVIVGFVMSGMLGAAAVPAPVAGQMTPVPGNSSGSPGALSNEQLQQGLPAGHVPISGASGAGGAMGGASQEASK